MPEAPHDPGQPVLETQLLAPTALAPAGAPPFTVGGVISRTMRVWWAHVGVFTAMSLVVYAPLIAAFGLFFTWALGAAEGRAPDPAQLGWRAGALFAGGAATVVLSVVQMGAVTYGTVCHLHGERAPLGRMLGVGFRRGLPVVGTGILVWLAFVAGFLLLFAPGIMFLVASSVAVPAAVVEKPGVVGAIRRSFDLTRGSRWPLFAAGLVIVVILWVLSGVVQLGTTLAASLLLSPGRAVAVTVVASQLGTALFSVLQVVAVAVSYHDLRRAKEGVDTSELARVFE